MQKRGLVEYLMIKLVLDWKLVADFARTGSLPKLVVNLDSILKKIGSKEFSPALRAGFGLRPDVGVQVKKTLRNLSFVKNDPTV